MTTTQNRARTSFSVNKRAHALIDAARQTYAPTLAALESRIERSQRQGLASESAAHRGLLRPWKAPSSR